MVVEVFFLGGGIRVKLGGVAGNCWCGQPKAYKGMRHALYECSFYVSSLNFRDAASFHLLGERNIFFEG